MVYYRPEYPDGADYNTNAKSYYDELARKEHLIKQLAIKVAEYDKELAKRFAEWDKLISEFPDDVKILLEKWLLDGTLGDILTDVFLSGKSNIITSLLEPEKANNQTYWYQIVNGYQSEISFNVDYDYLESRIRNGR